MVVSRRPVQTNQATSSSNYQYIHQALSSTGIKIAGVSLLVAASMVIATIETSGDQAADTSAPKPASIQTLSTTAEPTTETQPMAAAPEATTSGDATNNTTSNVNVTVNGQAMTVPANGTTQQTMTSSDGGTTQVQVSHHVSQAGSNSSFSSTSVSSHSFSMSNGVPMP